MLLECHKSSGFLKSVKETVGFCSGLVLHFHKVRGQEMDEAAEAKISWILVPSMSQAPKTQDLWVWWPGGLVVPLICQLSTVHLINDE